MDNIIYITSGYVGGEFFTNIHHSESHAKGFVEDFYRYRPCSRNYFVTLRIARVEKTLTCDELLSWSNDA